MNDKRTRDAMIRKMTEDFSLRHAAPVDNFSRLSAAQTAWRTWFGHSRMNSATAVQGLYR